MLPQIITPDDYRWWLEFAEGKNFRFASTMAATPHSYLIRFRNITDEEWSRWYGTLVAFGTPGKFYGRPNIYLRGPDDSLDRWWTMELKDHDKNLTLNFAWDGKEYGPQDVPDTRSKGWAPYDAFAAWWDDNHREVDQSEKVNLFKLVTAATGDRRVRALDIGSGTGGSIDTRMIGSDMTTAVDPSQGMMNLLYCKHSRIKELFTTTLEEYLGYEIGTKFDLALASYGSASHLSAEAIDELPKLAATSVLSFYRPGYRPRVYGLAGLEVDDADAMARAQQLATHTETRGNFVTYVLEAGR